MLRFFRFSVILSTMLASCSMQWITMEPVVQAYRNPHTLCINCHATGKPQHGAELFSPGTDPSDLCFNCHDYKENHHPVDFAPADSSNFRLPLFGGKLRCLTCHEIHGGPRQEGT